MIFDSRQVSSLKPLSQKYVSTANGSSTNIIGEGSLSLISNLNLDNVLVVPLLDYNLLSISQITTTLSFAVMFWPNYCVFEDIQTMKMIDYGTRREKLHCLNLESKSSNQLREALPINVFSCEDKTRKYDIWLWHR